MQPQQRDEYAQIRTPPRTAFGASVKHQRRRQRVYKLRLQGYSIRRISSHLGIHHSTVIADLRFIADTLPRAIDGRLLDAIFQRQLSDVRALRSLILEELAGATGNERVGILNAAIRNLQAQTALLKAAGFLGARA